MVRKIFSQTFSLFPLLYTKGILHFTRLFQVIISVMSPEDLASHVQDLVRNAHDVVLKHKLSKAALTKG